MTTIQRIATGIVATLALAIAAPASATPWDPTSRDPFIPIRPAPEPAMIAPAPTHPGSGPVDRTHHTPASGFDRGAASAGAAVVLSLGAVPLGLACSAFYRRRIHD